MQIFIYCKSWSYRVMKSPISTDWAFLVIFHVPRLITDQCSTILFISVKQS